MRNRKKGTEHEVYRRLNGRLYHGQRQRGDTGEVDGLHLGHQQLIRRICEKEKEGLESVVVTIWPNPKNPALLTKGEKKELLKKMGVSWWIDCPFLPEISHMSSEDFVRDILVKRLRAKYIAVGEDFRFGYQRKGDCHLLEQMKKELGYTLEIVPKEMIIGTGNQQYLRKRSTGKGKYGTGHRTSGVSLYSQRRGASWTADRKNLRNAYHQPDSIRGKASASQWGLCDKDCSGRRNIQWRNEYRI
ncbi:MAG: hypothetical protein V8T31_07265 [Lachnospiraceae bacterium]